MNIKMMILVTVMMCGFSAAARAEVDGTQKELDRQEVVCMWNARSTYPAWAKVITLGILSGTFEDSGCVSIRSKGGVKAFRQFFERNPDMLSFMDLTQMKFGADLRTLHMLCRDEKLSQSIWYVKGKGHTLDDMEALTWLEEPK